MSCEYGGRDAAGTTWRCSLVSDHDGKHRLDRVTPRVRDYKRGAKSPAPSPEWDKALGGFVANLRLRDMSERSIDLREYHIRRFARESGVAPFEATIDDLTTWLGAGSWNNATRSSVRASLRVFYAWAADSGRMDHDPSTKLPRIRPADGRPKPVPEADYAVALEITDSRIRLALRLMGDLGMRRAEVAHVHREDLIVTGSGYLLKILGKGRKERIIPVPTALAEDLNAHIGAVDPDGGYAFPGPSNGHLSPHWLGTLVSRALPEGYTGHKLRHRALTQAHRRSGDLLLTAKLAGHSSTATTAQYYVEPDYEALRSIVEGIAS